MSGRTGVAAALARMFGYAGAGRVGEIDSWTCPVARGPCSDRVEIVELMMRA